MISSLRKFSKDEVAKERLRIIEFYDEYGEKATKKAFNVKRNTIWVWKKRLKESRNSISSLIPIATTPHTKRAMIANPKIIAFIRELREKHPRLGKQKIKPLLDRYCNQNSLLTVSEAKIGRIIKKNNLFFQPSGRIYHNPDSGFARRKQTKRIRVRYAPKQTGLGYMEMDTVLRFVDGIRYYFYCAVDVRGKFAFSLMYKHLNSQNTVEYFKKLEKVCPYPITTIQTDNGLEFLGDFQGYLIKRGIHHVFIYPRCCRINGVVERFNRTIQEEFIDNNLDIIHNPILFNDKLIDYLLFYNTERVHMSLGLKTPIDYLITEGGMSKMSRAYTIG